METGVKTKQRRVSYVKMPVSEQTSLALDVLAAVDKADETKSSLGRSGTSARGQPPKGMMCNYLMNLFTTFPDFSKDKRKEAAHKSVLKAYQRLRTYGVQVWLFTESDRWAQNAESHDVLVVRRIDKNAHGTPLLGSMFKQVINATEAHDFQCKQLGKETPELVFDAYANGDIVFDEGLVDTLETVRMLWRERTREAGRNLMVIGKRTNVNFFADDTVDSFDGVRSMAAKGGKLFQNDAEDYFIYSRGARNWSVMPHFVVGRRAYDNWLVDNAYHDENLDLIDASKTVLALHLTTADGNNAGHSTTNADKEYNTKAFNPMTKKSVGPHEWDDGRTDHAHFFTKRKAGSIEIFKRKNTAGARQVPQPADH